MTNLAERLDEMEIVMWGDGDTKIGVVGRLDRLEQSDIRANLSSRDRQMIWYGPIVAAAVVVPLYALFDALGRYCLMKLAGG